MHVVKDFLALKQESAVLAARVCTDARELAVLDWGRLRGLLAYYRRQKPMTVAELAQAIEVAETTIYRIENVKKDDDYRPELQTIADWLEKTNGPSLPVFFAQIEGTSDELSLSVTEPTNDDPAVGKQGASHHGTRFVSPTPDRLALIELRAFISHLAYVLAAAAAADPSVHRSLPGASDEEAG